MARARRRVHLRCVLHLHALIFRKTSVEAVLVSRAWHLIWNLRRTRVIENPGILPTNKEIHNRWLKAVNGVLQRDCLLTNKIRFGPLAFNTQLVLKTWSGLLMDEDSLPVDWTHEGVLVGMRPIIDRHGIG
ncbi:hypothetical protein B0H10DRAFT_1836392 [Mycena sp. CBHHK59/15]|nr:hypothetical protein B0H10DRAFT_1836392 [Mycena sp. CBHHK59/15]